MADQSKKGGRFPEGKGATLLAFFTALRFLTVIPVSWHARYDGYLFRHSIYSFPIIGLVIGLVASGMTAVLIQVLPLPVTGYLLLIFLAAISGFLHLDGLADSADGLLSARPGEESLRIMRDSRTGAMGAIVLVIVLLGKYVCIGQLSFPLLMTAALLVPLSGRCAIVLTMALNRYARAEGGLGSLFYSGRARITAIYSLLLLIFAGAYCEGITGAALVLIAVISTVLLFSAFCRKRIGGVTGDTLGAVCELTELSVALGLTTLVSG